MSPQTPAPPPDLRRRVEAALGKKSTSWTRPDCGLSAAHRFSVRFEDGTSVFVKAATEPQTEEWLRTEHSLLTGIAREFMPAVEGWLDSEGEHPVLLSQDLSDAYWPASHQGVDWRPGQIELLFEGLEAISNLRAPDSLGDLASTRRASWKEIAAHPESFLEHGLCSEAWLTSSLDALIEAERDVDLEGDRLLHGDVRSDNICFVDTRAVFVDWSTSLRGNPSYNLASFLPGLVLESDGPTPYEVMPDGGGWAAMESGDLARRLETTGWGSGTRLTQGMPEWLRKVFKRIIVIDLQWAASCLGLPPPDGVDWRSI